MEAGPSRVYYDTDTVVGMVVDDVNDGPSEDCEDADLDEPMFCGSDEEFGCDEEIGLVEEEVGQPSCSETE